ncbi:MAG TPA: hypothetical protein VHZ03_37610 [Trebonia sp.]|nr:hypothetical protein [Trebonia sp.]
MPSSRPPIRSIAARDLALRASVFRVTRMAPHSWNACRSRTSLQAVLTCVPCHFGPYQVLPISATDGGCSSDGSGPGVTPGGQADGAWVKTSRSRNRVAPASWPLPSSRTANGTCRPPSRPASARST